MVCAGLLASPLALADRPPAPADGQAPDARKLGVTEAILDYCSTSSPETADKYRFEVARQTRGASPETLKNVRASNEYRQARGMEEDFLGKVDPHNAKHICAKSLVPRKK